MVKFGSKLSENWKALLTRAEGRSKRYFAMAVAPLGVVSSFFLAREATKQHAQLEAGVPLTEIKESSDLEVWAVPISLLLAEIPVFIAVHKAGAILGPILDRSGPLLPLLVGLSVTMVILPAAVLVADAYKQRAWLPSGEHAIEGMTVGQRLKVMSGVVQKLDELSVQHKRDWQFQAHVEALCQDDNVGLAQTCVDALRFRAAAPLLDSAALDVEVAQNLDRLQAVWQQLQAQQAEQLSVQERQIRVEHRVLAQQGCWV